MGLADLFVQGALAAILSLSGQTSSPNLLPTQDILADSLMAGAHNAKARSSYERIENRVCAGSEGSLTDDCGVGLTSISSMPRFQTGPSFEISRSYPKGNTKLGSPYAYLVDLAEVDLKFVSLDQVVLDPELLPRNEAISWIQQVTGFSDERAAKFLGVSRRALLDWKAGKAIKESNLKRLLETRDVLQRAQRHQQGREHLLGWLYTPDSIEGVSPATLLERGDFDRARFLAIAGPTTVEPSIQPVRRVTSPVWQSVVERPPRLDEFEELD